MASATVAHGLLADGQYVITNGTSMGGSTPNTPLSPPHGPAVSIAPTLEGYVSLEPRDMGGVRRLHARRFIFGHGSSLEVMNTFIDGVSASPVAPSGDALLRLVTGGVREVDLAVERRGLADFATLGAPSVLQRGAACDASAGRGWVLLGIDGNGAMFSLHGRCIERAR